MGREESKPIAPREILMGFAKGSTHPTQPI
jgi:hypothetical protein